MFGLLKASQKAFILLVASLILVACGSGSGDSKKSADNNVLSQDTQFMYVQRNVAQDFQFNTERLKLSKTNRDSSPFDLASPYEFKAGAQLMSRSSLDVNAIDTEVLTSYFNSSEYDVKDLNISPDGQYLVFAAHGPHDHLTDYTWNIYEYSFKDKSIRRIIEDDLIANAGQDTNPTYALDGSIVFSSDRAVGNPNSPVDNIVDQYQADNCYKVGPNEKPSLLHSMTNNGENILQLTYGRNHDTKPTTLKDGRIAFVRWSRTYELLQNCPVDGATTSTTDIFNAQYPTGLDMPAQWSLAAVCANAHSTPIGKVLASNHYTILRITADGKELQQLYKTVTLTGSDESFIGIEHIVQAENGQLAALLKHQYTQSLGGNIVELQSPESVTATSVFGNIAPVPVMTGEVDLYPNQHSVNGWYSAVWPYRDGTGRLLVSWSQCSTVSNGINTFCQSSNEPGKVNGQYGIWVFDEKTQSRLPVVRARANTVYSDIAISQPNNGLDFPFNAYSDGFVDNLDTNRVICDDPGIVVPPLGNTYASSVAANPNSSAASTPVGIAYSSVASSPVVVTNSSASKAVVIANSSAASAPVVIANSSVASIPVQIANSSAASVPAAITSSVAASTPVITSSVAASTPVITNSSAASTPVAIASSAAAYSSTTTSTAVNSSSAPKNTIATANAGANQTGNVGSTFTLDGSGSRDADGDVLTYKWLLLSSPADSTLAQLNWTSVKPSVIPDKAGNYVVQLIVNDGKQDSLPATVVITAVQPNQKPIANGGPDQSVNVNENVILSAVGSSDADGDTLTYSWTLITQPGSSNLVLNNASSVTTGFTPEYQGVYSFQLIVRDGLINSEPDTVVVTVNQPNRKPVANAGPDQHANIGTLVTLDGSGSSDVDGDTLTYKWEIISPAQTTTKLSSASTVMPTFTILDHGLYVVRLIVNDGKLDSDPDTVSFEIGNVKPVANAGVDQKGYVNTVAQLNASLSSDLDGDVLTYKWRIVAAPESSNAQIVGATAVMPVFTPDEYGIYTIELVVNDGLVSSNPDTVVIDTRNSRPVANAGADQSVSIDDLAELNGIGSVDADGQTLTYSWSVVSKPVGSAVALLTPDQTIAKLKIDKAGSYVIQLVVNDGIESSEPDTIVLNTKNIRPVAEAGKNKTVYIGDQVSLDGSGSYDSDGDKLSYSWSLTTKPSNSVTSLVNVSAVNPTFKADKEGTYIAQLIVNDGTLGSAPDTVTITVEQPVCNIDSNTMRTLPVTIRDFKAYQEVGGHIDFENKNISDVGIVEVNLGADHLPVYANKTGGTPSTHGATYFNQWFRDVSGVNKNIPKTLQLKRSVGSSIWTYHNEDFFPIDGLGFGDYLQTGHNFHFTLEAHLEFNYNGGEVFEFQGDDDLWVFINGKRVIDLGGVHSVQNGSVDLDEQAAKLGIVKGQSYTFDLFFAERHTTKSEFMFQTDINLECVSTAQ
ncbi:MAG: PKD domain-containing protein [Pseudomonadota bacterium]